MDISGLSGVSGSSGFSGVSGITGISGSTGFGFLLKSPANHMPKALQRSIKRGSVTIRKITSAERRMRSVPVVLT